MELGFHPEHLPDEDNLQAQLTATLSSEDLGVAVATLLKKYAAEDPAFAVEVATRGPEKDVGNVLLEVGAGVETFEARACAAVARLQGFRVEFVRDLRSRFLRFSDGGVPGGVGREEDITAPHGAGGSIFFVREVRP